MKSLHESVSLLFCPVLCALPYRTVIVIHSNGAMEKGAEKKSPGFSPEILFKMGCWVGQLFLSQVLL